MNFIKGLGLRKLDGEFLQHTLNNFDGEFPQTLLVIVTVNCGEFLKHTLSNCDGELR